MTKAQKKILLGWAIMATLLLAILLFDDWILEHWEAIKWPSLILILVIVTLSKKKSTTRNGREEINRIVEENSWIKIYLALYGIVLAIGTSYVIYNSINISEKGGVFEMLGAIILLILPIFIIQQKEAYIEAGK